MAAIAGLGLGAPLAPPLGGGGGAPLAAGLGGGGTLPVGGLGGAVVVVAGLVVAVVAD